MNLHKLILVNNRCYKAGRMMTPTGILVHSTGANNPNLSRYVGPDDGLLGPNKYNNHWNSPEPSACVNAFIGKLKDGTIATYQTLPWDMKPWGCASGPKGSFNNSHIQFEICEDGLTDRTYFDKVYKEAVELCAYLCKMYNIKASSIVCHCEANKMGYASAHADVMHWFPKHGKSMDTFRSDVQKMLDGGTVNVQTPTVTPEAPKPTPTTPTQSSGVPFLIKVTEPTGLNIRKGPGTNYGKNGAIPCGLTKYTIVEVKGDWGRLKSGAGWICLTGYTQRV